MSLESYWTITHGHANRTGWSCRECHAVIYQGEPIVIRDGRKLRLMYHERCYSGDSDPRTQTGSSYYDNKWINAHSIQGKAPSVKGYGKWSCSEYGYKGDLYATSSNVKLRSRSKESNDTAASQSTIRKTGYSNSSKKTL
ncbi:unnamed protein product [Rotaria sp. Silwood2]|nr:unnamed protein product [Rotaria sp. Silwood2]CAF2958232.1 unnamed protein product [Rotaria sp. Silwood2]CAF3048018.1 unnamed protein product [Rotaria sp. Silwood2]CAF3300171.1 unnamed protein product [Rotaria sp. Silwood2]CAF4236855.1 unnamed protein product [Rotaria sp. Silwood2]